VAVSWHSARASMAVASQKMEIWLSFQKFVLALPIFPE